MEVKVTFKLHTQQLKIRSYIFVHFGSFGEKKTQKPNTKKRAWSTFCPACLDGGSAPMDLLTLIFYRDCLLMSNRHFPEGTVPWFAFLLSYRRNYARPLALFLLKREIFMRTGLPWKQQSLSLLTFSHGWFLPPNTNTGQKKTLHKNEDQPQKWHCFSFSPLQGSLF